MEITEEVNAIGDRELAGETLEMALLGTDPHDSQDGVSLQARERAQESFDVLAPVEMGDAEYARRTLGRRSVSEQRLPRVEIDHLRHDRKFPWLHPVEPRDSFGRVGARGHDAIRATHVTRFESRLDGARRPARL